MTPGEKIALASLVMVLVFNLISQWRNAKLDDSSEAEQITKISMQLTAVLKGVDEIRTEIKDMKDDIKVDHDKVILMEREVKALWKKVDMGLLSHERGDHENA